MFDQSLQRLRAAANERQRGVSIHQRVVLAADLQQLLMHFERVDNDYRALVGQCEPRLSLRQRFAALLKRIGL